MHDSKGKRFINNHRQWLCNTGKIECKVTTQFGRNRVRRGWSVMWVSRSITSFACCVRDSCSQLFRLKQYDSFGGGGNSLTRGSSLCWCKQMRLGCLRVRLFYSSAIYRLRAMVIWKFMLLFLVLFISYLYIPTSSWS